MMTVRDALPDFYKRYDLPQDGGVNDPAVRLELLKGIYLYIPNPAARKKAVLKHDIHHLITGYSGTLKGETEISTWELSTGCGNNWLVFSINIYGMMTGAIWNLRGLWKAWLKGKRTKNLYHDRYRNEELRGRTIIDLKLECGFLDESVHEVNTAGAFLSFFAFLTFGTVYSMASMILLPPAVLYSMFVSIKRSNTRR